MTSQSGNGKEHVTETPDVSHIKNVDVTYEHSDEALEVIVPDAPGERQGRCELHLFLETWQAHHPGLELEVLD